MECPSVAPANQPPDATDTVPTVGNSVDPSVEPSLVPLFSKVANNYVVSTSVQSSVPLHVVTPDATKDFGAIPATLSFGVDHRGNTVGEPLPPSAIVSPWLSPPTRMCWEFTDARCKWGAQYLYAHGI